jgi:putative hydrolase of the HAD superfamily
MIKNIIFDFGGVIYDIDHQKTKYAFVQLGLAYFDRLYSHAVQTKLFENFETGKIAPADFRKALRAYLPTNCSLQAIDRAWNALLLGFDKERLLLVRKIAQHYNLFLLSNTNQIHYDYFFSELKTTGLEDLFVSSFKKLYFSHQIGLRKPDLESFKLVIEENALSKNETLFIDDFDLNISAAKMSGLHTMLLEPGMDLFSLFSAEGKLFP